MIGELGTTVLDWRNAALSLGENLAPDGPTGYYEFTPAQWLAWARDHLPRPQEIQTELLKNVAETKEHLQETRRLMRETCVWTPDTESDKWDTACDRAFTFIVDGPRENDYRHCPGCGRAIKEARRDR